MADLKAAAKEIEELRANGAYVAYVDYGQDWLDARDRRMMAKGAAEELRKMASGSRSRTIELCDAFATGVRAEQQAWIRELNERAAEIEAAGEGEGNG